MFSRPRSLTVTGSVDRYSLAAMHSLAAAAITQG